MNKYIPLHMSECYSSVPRKKIIAPIERKIREQAEIDIKHALKPYR